MKIDQILAEGADERGQKRLWAQITDYEKRAKATSNDIKKQHLLKMADELRGKLKTNVDESAGNVGDAIVSLYDQIYELGDDAVDHLYHNAPLFAQFWDQYEGDINSIVAEVSPKNLIRIKQELEAAAKQEGLMEFAPSGGDDDGDNDDALFRFAKMWYSAPDVATQRRVEQALAKAGWEIGELESEEGGAFVMRIGDDAGDSYIGWSEEDLAGLEEGDVVAFPKKHRGDITNMHECPKCGGDLQGGKYQGHEVQVCMPCKQVYLPPNSGIDQQGNKIKEQGVSEAPGAETLAHNQSTVASNEKAFDLEEGKDKKPEPPEADYGDDYQAMVSRVKKLAGMGPLKTVYDPQKRVYKNVPTAVQPKK